MSNFKLKITEQAKIDIKTNIEYIANDKKQIAKSILTYLYASCNRLTSFPKLGIQRPDFTYKEYRFLILKFNFIIAYKIDGNYIIISRVLTGYQDIYNLFK